MRNGLLFLVTVLLTACNGSVTNHFDKGGNLVCEVERGFLFGGNDTVTVNNRNASEGFEYGAHGQGKKVYNLDNGKRVAMSSCRISAD